MRRFISLAALSCAALLAGCSSTPAECSVDSECGTGVCARDGACTPTSEVRQVRTTWTINGQPASAARCPAEPLYVEFGVFATDETLEFDPVPCSGGVYTIDKLPRRFDSVEVGVDTDGGAYDWTMIDSSGTAQLDLEPSGS